MNFGETHLNDSRLSTVSIMNVWKDSCDLGAWRWGSSFSRGNGKWGGKLEEGSEGNVHSEQRDGVEGVRAGWKRVETGVKADRREVSVSPTTQGSVTPRQTRWATIHGCKVSEFHSLCCEILQASLG